MKHKRLDGSATASAADRFFRIYKAHRVSPNRDTVFNVLNALHSLNDKLRKEYPTNFFSLKEFIALKALRNRFHHHEELLSEVRIVPSDQLPLIVTDLNFLCLIPRPFVENALADIDAKHRLPDGRLARESLKWYGNVVNINPCIFNFAVHVYEMMIKLNLPLSSKEFQTFRESYEFEDHHGHSHFVTGEIACHAGSVNSVLETAFADVV